MSDTNENREYFIKALREVVDEEMEKELDGIEDCDMEIYYSDDHKRKMNRIMRERVGTSKLPFPEVDSRYERIRSRLVVIFHINSFSDRHKERKRRKEIRKIMKKRQKANQKNNKNEESHRF